MYLASRSDDEGTRIMVGQKEGRRKQTGRMSWASVAGGDDLVVQQVVMTHWAGRASLTGRNTKRARQCDVYSLSSLSSHFLLKAQGAPIDELPSAPSSFVIKPAAAHLRTEYMEALLWRQSVDSLDTFHANLDSSPAKQGSYVIANHKARTQSAGLAGCGWDGKIA